MLEQESASSRYHVCQFSVETDNFTFLAQICPERKLGFEIQKHNVGIRISILEIPCVPIFRWNGQLWLFGPKFAQKRTLGSKFQNSKSGFGISVLEVLFIPIFRQIGQLWIFGPKFALKWTLGSKFQKSKSGLKISTSIIPCVRIFSQNGQLLIFRPKFGEIAQLRAIFCFNYCWGYYREVGGGWNELVGGGWSWMELGGGGWSWVEVGARFSNTRSEGFWRCLQF